MTSIERCTRSSNVQWNKQNLLKAFTLEKQFISNLFSIIAMPDHEQPEEDDCVYVSKPKASKEEALNAKRAKSFRELNERLDKLKGTKDFSVKNKLMKRSLARRLKKKTKKEERRTKKKLSRIKKKASNAAAPDRTKEEPSETEAPQIEAPKKHPPVKPVFNSQGKMVFSKFDFSESGIPQDKRKGARDPKQILENLKKQKDKVRELKQTGDTEKAVVVMEKIAWKNALSKAEGQKIKDDPILLKKSMKKQEQEKKKSSKKWEQRLQTVEKAKEDRQKKREKNLNKRKQEKKKKVVKKAIKKGRMLA